MRVILIILFSILFTLYFISCKNKTAVSGQNPGSKIEFSDTVYDYGDMIYDSDGNCVFEFRNTSDKPLIINNVRASCGCTNAEWPENPVKPGMKGLISIRYNTKITGTFRKSITVYSNADNSPAKLFIKGNVLDENFGH